MRQWFVSALLAMAVSGAVPADAQTVGAPLPPWQPGTLDIHLINTGRGDAAFMVFPDGTSLQFDAGDDGFPQENPRSVPVPIPSGSAGERIGRYVERVMRPFRTPEIDYALVSHLHRDHIAAMPDLARVVPIRKLLDRGWPEYAPGPAPAQTGIGYYLDFAKATPARMERFEAGRADQITLKHAPADYPTFVVRNIAVNGQVWTGVGSVTRSRFPDNWQALSGINVPTENQTSLAIRVSYGAFDFYTGGDLPGLLRPGAPAWQDIETWVAQAVGPVEVAVANHHGVRDSTNPFFVSTLQPRLWLLQVWAVDHPAHDTVDRMLSRDLYPGDRDILATNFGEANRAVIGPMVERITSTRGHIVIRVDKGGGTYRAFVLEDTDESMRVKAILGPFTSR